MSDFAFLKTDPEAVSLGGFLTEIEKLKRIRTVNLPINLFEGISPKLVKTYRQRAATENGEVCHGIKIGYSRNRSYLKTV